MSLYPANSSFCMVPHSLHVYILVYQLFGFDTTLYDVFLFLIQPDMILSFFLIMYPCYELFLFDLISLCDVSSPVTWPYFTLMFYICSQLTWVSLCDVIYSCYQLI